MLLDASISLTGIGQNAEKLEKTANLELTFYNENDKVPEEVNEDVELNIMRVRGAKAL